MKRLLIIGMVLCSCSGGMQAGRHGKRVKNMPPQGKNDAKTVCVVNKHTAKIAEGDKPVKKVSIPNVILCDECNGECCSSAITMDELFKVGWEEMKREGKDLFGALALTCRACKKERFFALERCACDAACSDCRQTRNEKGLGTRCGISLDDQVGNKELFELCHPEMSTGEVNALFKVDDKEHKENLFDEMYNASTHKGKRGVLGKDEELKRIRKLQCHPEYNDFFGKMMMILLQQKDIESHMMAHIQLVPVLQRYLERRRNGTLGSVRCSRDYVASRCYIENFFREGFSVADNMADLFALVSCLIKKDSIENAALRTCYDCIVVNADSYYERVCTDLKLLFKDVPNGAQRARELAINKVKSIYAGDHMDELLEFKNNPKSCFHTFKNEIKQDLEQGRLKNVSVRTTSDRDLDNAAYLMASSAGFLSKLTLNNKS